MIVSVIAAFIVGGLIAWLVERSRTRGQIAVLEKSSRDHFEQWTEASETLDRTRQELAEKNVSIARLEERNQAERQVFEEMRAKLPATFKNLASEILEEKSKAFVQQNQLNLGQLLDPLKTRLKDFQDKVEMARVEQAKDGAALKQQVESLLKANTEISKEANQLAEALKGSNKVQGNWGELVLERILESAGLREGEEFNLQVSHSLENGNRVRPDCVVHLPDNKHLVIDSKVSLTAYEQAASAATEEAEAAASAAHLRSVRAHIEELSRKNYQALYGLNSLDFVIMFLPVEPALLLALSRDSQLWEFAFQKNILLAGPGTLLFALRTVACLWQQERQQRNAQAIADRGQELYDKFTGFVKDMHGLGKELNQAQEVYSKALGKLSSGRGNLIRQAEMLRDLGVKATHALPPDLVDSAKAEDAIAGSRLLDSGEPDAMIHNFATHDSASV